MVHAPPARKKSHSNNDENANGINGLNGTTSVSPATPTKCEMELDMQPVPPDGGWGWMVVFGSFMIHIVTDGMTYSFGLFYNEFLTYFNEGKGYTAWIASIMVGVTFASGPISSSFVNRYGCRAVTIAGSLLAASSIIVSMFAQNVFTLILTIGFGTGFGFGLIYLPAIVSVTQYFDAKRSLATGIAVCGSGFGTFVFAPLTQYLLETYGWRGSLLIIGGVVLNCIIFGALFRPLEAPNKSKISSKKSAIIDNNTTKGELEPLKSKSSHIKQTDQYLQPPQRTEGANSLCRSNSVGHNLKPNLNNNSSPHSNKKQTTAINIKSTSNDDITRVCASQPQLGQSVREKSTSGTMYRPDAFYQGSLLNIPEYANSRNDVNYDSGIKRYGSLRQGIQNQERAKCCGCISCSKETRDTFAEMMNFSLLKDPIFIIFALSNFCTSIGFNMPYLYVVGQAIDLNIETSLQSSLIATIGIANTVGRIILGYISDKSWVNRLLIYNLCLTLCGIATALVPLCTDYYSLITYCAVFGFTIGAYVGLTSVILVDLLGLEKLTNAFGLLLLFQGIASLIGAPIGGWMYDITSSYGPAFMMAGIMIALSGVVMFAIPPIQRCNALKTEQKINSEHLALS